MIMNYYNTTDQRGDVLLKYHSKAKSQEDFILGIFQTRGSMSASEVFKQMPSNYVPITSVRRAMTNLKTEGKIRITNRRVKGMYGRDEIVYEITKQQLTLF